MTDLVIDHDVFGIIERSLRKSHDFKDLLLFSANQDLLFAGQLPDGRLPRTLIVRLDQLRYCFRTGKIHLAV